jgi:hypothetical protein
MKTTFWPSADHDGEYPYSGPILGATLGGDGEDAGSALPEVIPGERYLAVLPREGRVGRRRRQHQHDYRQQQRRGQRAT